MWNNCGPALEKLLLQLERKGKTAVVLTSQSEPLCEVVPNETPVIDVQVCAVTETDFGRWRQVP